VSDTGVLAAAGLALEYQRLPATRAGPTLVLLHEGLGCVAMWKRFPGLLHAATGLEVFVWSRAGYGASTPVTLPRPLDFHTQEGREVLPAVLAAAGIHDCILIGHSDGASIAIIHMGSGPAARIRALVLMAPHVLTEARTVMTIGEARRQFQGADLRARLARRHGDNVDTAFWGWCDTWLDPRFARWNIEMYLPAITVPVLLVRGDDDPYSGTTHIERIARGARGEVSCSRLPGCGHAPHLEQPERVADEVARFVMRVAAAAPTPRP
jgi:pimeloyl-ACP methyl ester carboxylesterase